MPTVNVKDRPCRVLIIEDDEDDVFLLQRELAHVERALNRKVLCDSVHNGLDAILLITKQLPTEKLPDVLVLDLNMPMMDGIAFLGSIRKSPLLKDLPVFVLTTARAPTVHANALRAGANKVFVKPGNSAALFNIAKEIVAGAG